MLFACALHGTWLMFRPQRDGDKSNDDREGNVCPAIRNLLQTKRDRQQSDENNRKREWERKPAAPSLLRLRANAQFTSWMAVDFLRLHSRSVVRSRVVPGSQVVPGVVPCHCRAWAGGLCCRVR